MPSGGELSNEEKRENAVSEALVTQLLADDVIVVGAPTYDFTVPTQLKTWTDRIAQKGCTFACTATGPAGLATGKPVVIASARGGA